MDMSLRYLPQRSLSTVWTLLLIFDFTQSEVNSTPIGYDCSFGKTRTLNPVCLPCWTPMLRTSGTLGHFGGTPFHPYSLHFGHSRFHAE